MAQLCHTIRKVRNSSTTRSMPDHPQWFHRIPEILSCLQTSTVPFLDRLAIEQVFGVQRRQAIRILSSLGGYQLGRTFLVERETVISALRLVVSEGRFQQASAQRKRVWRAIAREQGRLRAKAIPVRPPPARPLPGHLPEGVMLAGGELRVRFEDSVGLLEKLMALAEQAAEDFTWFQELCEGDAVCESEVSANL